MRKVLFVMCLLVACKKEEAAPATKPSAEPPPAEAAKAEVKEEAKEAKEAPARAAVTQERARREDGDAA